MWQTLVWRSVFRLWDEHVDFQKLMGVIKHWLQLNRHHHGLVGDRSHTRGGPSPAHLGTLEVMMETQIMAKSVHPFTTFHWPRVWWQQDYLLMGWIIPPVSSESSMRSPPSWMCPEDSKGKHPNHLSQLVSTQERAIHHFVSENNGRMITQRLMKATASVEWWSWQQRSISSPLSSLSLFKYGRFSQWPWLQSLKYIQKLHNRHKTNTHTIYEFKWNRHIWKCLLSFLWASYSQY